MIDTMTLTVAEMSDLPLPYFLAPLGAVLALITALIFSRAVMSHSEGDTEMIRIAQAVRDGAMAYLVRQYQVVAGVFVVLVLALAGMAALGLQEWLTVLGVPVAGLLSGLCGWFGMRMATNASARTAAAVKDSLNDGLKVAFRSGAVMGMVVVGFALLDVSFWFFLLNSLPEDTLLGIGLDGDLRTLTTVMLSFGMGASTQALFARVGGGIYTKAADVGADLVGKVEAGIPEDDARNPATIADNVGDNVGDVAGMGADLYESYYGSILATMALGAAAAFSLTTTSMQGGELALKLATAPLAIAGAGIVCSIIGIFAVRAKEGASFAQLLQGLHAGVYVASGLIALAALGLLFMLFDSEATLIGGFKILWWRLGLSIITGLAAGLVIAHATEYYTSYEHPPTKRIANQAITGPATVIISGIAEGMKSTWAPLLTVVIAIIAAFTFAGGNDNFLMGLYGVGIAAVGMLSTLGITLATDAYGPIADNAGGNAEMTGQPPHVRERTDMLDSLGNTTAATGKGFAIGSAALTALALFAAYIQIVKTQLSTQAVAYEQTALVTNTEEAGSSAYAIYQGHGRFAMVIPESDSQDKIVDAALIDLARADRKDYEDLAVGSMLSVVEFDPPEIADSIEDRGHVPPLSHRLGVSRRVVLTGTVTYENHSEEIEFEALAARNAQLGDILRFYNITLMNPRALGGMFIGVLLAFLFCAMTMDAVGRAANSMMQECRRQFAKMREAFRANGMSEEQIADPMQWPKQVEHEGVEYPDYAQCVVISTASAQREMVAPAMLALVTPLLVGLLLDVPGVVGMLAGGLTCGFALAIYMANAGGAWDNAKKMLESFGKITANDFESSAEARAKVPEEVREAIGSRAKEFVSRGAGDTIVYGKGSEDHKATVVGDTVGDPFKDTSGPSLNILIKLISIVSVVFAGLIVKYGPLVGDLIGLQ